MQEEFRPVKDYEELYEISNLGRVKSLAKEWVCGNRGTIRTKPETFLKSLLDGQGYLCITPLKKGIQKIKRIHHLVWDHFGNEQRNGLKLQIDHIDGNCLNNRIDNLQLLSQRENTSKGYRAKKTSSKYTGVSWNKSKSKWCAEITNNWKKKHLGYFEDEYLAHLTYQKALKELQEKQSYG